MNLDIRTPIGYFFTITGAILVVFGLLTGLGVIAGPEIYEKHSLGFNVNLYWGMVLLAFGLIMVLMARRAGQTPASNAPQAGERRPAGH